MVITEIRCRAIDLPMSAVRFEVGRMTLFAFIIAFITNTATNVMQLCSRNIVYSIETIMILIVALLCTAHERFEYFPKRLSGK